MVQTLENWSWIYLIHACNCNVTWSPVNNIIVLCHFHANVAKINNNTEKSLQFVKDHKMKASQFLRVL